MRCSSIVIEEGEATVSDEEEKEEEEKEFSGDERNKNRGYHFVLKRSDEEL